MRVRVYVRDFEGLASAPMRNLRADAVHEACHALPAPHKTILAPSAAHLCFYSNTNVHMLNNRA